MIRGAFHGGSPPARGAIRRQCPARCRGSISFESAEPAGRNCRLVGHDAHGIVELICGGSNGEFAGRPYAGTRFDADCLWPTIRLRTIRPSPTFLVIVADTSARFTRDPDSFCATLRTAS